MFARWTRGVAVLGAGFLMAIQNGAPAQAVPISYVSDVCSSSGNQYCFEIYYDSAGASTGYSYSSCFLANQSVPDHLGYSPNGAVLVRYMFEGGTGRITGSNPGCTGGSGDGLGLKNAAASAVNNECGVNNIVYYNSGYQGTSQTITPGCGDDWPSTNLKSTLKNENASHKRV